MLILIMQCLLQMIISMCLNSLPEETVSQVAAGTFIIQTSEICFQIEK